MRQRVGLVVVLACVGIVVGMGRLHADPETEDHPAEAAPAAPHVAEPAEPPHEAVVADHEAARRPETQAEEHEAPPAADADEDEIADSKVSMFDLDGDGKDDPSLKQDYDTAFAGISPTIDTAEVDRELDARPATAELKPSMTIAQFRTAVRMAKKIVLAKMEKKMAKGSAKKMEQFSTGIFVFSLLGLLLLGIPLVVGRRYPGKTKILFKYSALAAVTFVITVNLFGGVLMGMRTVQGELGSLTNPSLAIAAGTFDTLDRNAEEYVTMGKELFVPTLEQLRGNSDEQPSVLLIENGQKIVKDAKVFVAVAKMFKKVDFVFKILPIVLFGLTMILFGLAIRPTLTEIVRLPMRAAQGHVGVGSEVTRLAMRRVWGELLATVCTIGVLAALTVGSAFVLGEIVGPALDALLGYFSLAVSYLQFVAGASSGIVFLTLFGVVLFLILNLASLILSMSFYLGKTQKIFQARFNDGVPLGTHKRFFTWGTVAVVFVQVFPWLFALIADKALLAINASMLDGVTDANKVAWTKLMLAGPLFLVAGFVVLFWAMRGFKAIGFLQGYQVKPQQPKPPSLPAEAV